MATFEISSEAANALIEQPPPSKIPAPDIYLNRTNDNYQPTEDLLDARRMRGAVVQALTQGGIPVADKGQMELLLKALKDQDGQALGLIRAKVESGTADVLSEMKNAALAMISAARENRGQGLLPVTDVESRVIPTLDESELPPDDQRTFVEGELGTGVVGETFEAFARKIGGVTLAEKDEEEE